MKDKAWDIAQAWMMMNDPKKLNHYKEVMFYQSG